MADRQRRNSGSDEREAAGLLVIDKPAGWTSRDVVNRIQRITGIRRCGHAGTLDPLATGVLVVCVGRATRLVPYVQDLTKQYLASFRFGWRSNTDDIEGELEEVHAAELPSRSDLTQHLDQYRGEIEQIPPQFSAVKVQGKRAYALARQGTEVSLQPRRVTITHLELRQYTPPDWEVRMRCGSGTYVRSLGRDIGTDFGCGALMTSLVREAIGPFQLVTAQALEALSRENWRQALLPPVEAVRSLPCYECPPTSAQRLCQGRAILLAELSPLNTATAVERDPLQHLPPAQPLAILNQQGELLAIGFPDEQTVKPRLVLATG